MIKKHKMLRFPGSAGSETSKYVFVDYCCSRWFGIEVVETSGIAHIYN